MFLNLKVMDILGIHTNFVLIKVKLTEDIVFRLPHPELLLISGSLGSSYWTPPHLRINDYTFLGSWIPHLDVRVRESSILLFVNQTRFSMLGSRRQILEHSFYFPHFRLRTSNGYITMVSLFWEIYIESCHTYSIASILTFTCFFTYDIGHYLIPTQVWNRRYVLLTIMAKMSNKDIISIST